MVLTYIRIKVYKGVSREKLLTFSINPNILAGIRKKTYPQLLEN